MFRYRSVVSLFFSFLLVLLLASPVTSVKPDPQGSDGLSNELTIIYPKNEFFSIQEIPFKLHFHIINASGFSLLASQVSCGIHVYNSSNNHVLSDSLVADSNNIDVYATINSSVVNSGEGIYPYIVYCNSTVVPVQAGFLSNSFEVTRDGFSNELYSPVAWLPLLLGLAFMSFLFIYASRQIERDDNLRLKMFLFLIGVLDAFLVGVSFTGLVSNAGRVDLFKSVALAFAGVNVLLLVAFIFLFGVYLFTRFFRLVNRRYK